MNNTLVLLPSLNEEVAIKKTIEDIKQYVPRSTIWVIDSSTDKTPMIAEKAGASVIPVPRQGKGSAIRDAIWLLNLTHAITKIEYVIMIDCDYTYPAEHIPDIVDLLWNGADVVAGYRHNREKGAITPVNIIGNIGLSILASLFYRHYIRDVCTGMWGFKADVLKRVNIRSNGFTLEADLYSNVLSSGYKLVQLPIDYRARPNGSSSSLKVSDGFKIASFIIKHRR